MRNIHINQFKRILRNFYIRVKYYKLERKDNALPKTVVMFIENGYHKQHPGLVDRFKAIVGMYYIAKKNGWDFKLVFTTPFCLEEYLEPNLVDWKIDRQDISCDLFDTRLIEYNAFGSLPTLKNNIKQYHCYFYEGFNFLQKNNISDWETEWAKMFHMLFKPSKRLESLLTEYLPSQPYVAVHFRFVNALEHFEDGYDNAVSKEDQRILIDKCLETLKGIKIKENKDVYVFTDSAVFSSIAKEKGYNTVGTNDIGHISFETKTETYDKTFLDLFAISRAARVYAIHGNVLYNSVFPYYAAIIGRTDYVILEIQ